MADALIYIHPAAVTSLFSRTFDDNTPILEFGDMALYYAETGSASDGPPTANERLVVVLYLRWRRIAFNDSRAGQLCKMVPKMSAASFWRLVIYEVAYHFAHDINYSAHNITPELNLAAVLDVGHWAMEPSPRSICGPVHYARVALAIVVRSMRPAWKQASFIASSFSCSFGDKGIEAATARLDAF